MGKNKGITIIALVITVIILLILAGVTLINIEGENTLIFNTAETKEKAEIRQEIEIINKSAEQAMREDKHG